MYPRDSKHSFAKVLVPTANIYGKADIEASVDPVFRLRKLTVSWPLQAQVG